MKKILFLITTLHIGGAEHVLVNIANHLAEGGYSVTVQTLLDEGYYREKLNSQVRYRRGFRPKTCLGRKVVMRLLRMMPGRLLESVLIGKGYSHLVAFLEGVPTKIIGKCSHSDAKKIGWIHTDLNANYALDRIFGSLENCKNCYRMFDHLICVSEDAKEGYLKKMGQHKSVLVRYNPIDKKEILQKSKAVPAFKVREGDAFRLVALGRLVPEKGFDLLLEAMALTQKQTNKNVELYVIGGGPEEALLKQKISACQLEDRVFFCGQQTNPYSIMHQCDLQVISSRVEGFPLSLCEGHLLGLPAVATKCAGPKEILTASGAGILVEISAEGIAEGILRMVNDSELYLHYRNKAEIWSYNYDESDIYSQIEEIFA